MATWRHAELFASVTLAQSAGDQTHDEWQSLESDDDAMDQPHDECQSLESDDDAMFPNDAEATDDGAFAVTFSTALQSLDNLRAYLETAGCDLYENFCSLVDHVYNINKQHSVQKTTKDFFLKK